MSNSNRLLAVHGAGPPRNEVSHLLTVRETARLLNLRESTIRMWLLKRKLPRVRCGRAVRVPSDAVERFIAANTVPAREPL